ncbi:hypothetical protein [Variovorax ginsengisoli]|uniref:DUF423 domain-containing protein n=1 Tax=Variovorax ginsengisoli TaxID=363844 RepID=A0ABT8S9K0_9BURK|nr:hypothetical protein [Variovorax ginsengisoli]MDN8616421.1 hypothetical protein [Variovorax ginsengisoli]MDO1535591.1 hypothetical protein [Variovorax ginsengisoli]
MRLGIVVNFLFFVLGSAVLIALHIAWDAHEALGGKVRNEIQGQLHHSGYALHLIAGCAFFGAFSPAEAISGPHIAFALLWIVLLQSLLLFEFLRSNTSKKRESFSWSRKAAIPTSVFFVWWAWAGATP